MRFIDLFCGIGGFRLVLDKRGLNCVFSSDFDPYVAESYKLNFGESPLSDITQISENKIPDHEILCAGFPCQPFSMAGQSWCDRQCCQFILCVFIIASV